MKTIVEKPTKTILFGAAVATAVLLIMLLAVNLATGTARADGSLGGNDGATGNADSYINLSTYPDPQPCGPGAGTEFMEEPHEIRTGHYALFDAYWRTISKGNVNPGADGVGVLHTNLCPPEIVKKNLRGRTIIDRSARNGGMDIDEAIIHVLNKHLATTVASNAGAGEMSLAEYPDVKKYAPAGSQVWWLKLDDPRSTTTDEASDLGMGFSTLLLDKERWLTRDEGKPMRYKFEVERHPADPTDVPHFFAYEAPNIRAESPGTGVKLVWDSAYPGEEIMELNPGEYRALQWVFTEPGTYILWVHLLGDVRKDNPHSPGDPDYDPNWNAISSNDTETSEVYQYTIQVGDTLDETEPPIFGVNLEVEENSPGGVKVGGPIPIYNAEADVLYYDLTGPGHSNFELVAASSTAPHTVQVAVADGARLDYEEMKEGSKFYELALSVTDKVDHEDNFNPYPDDVLIVRIDVKDQDPGLVLEADRTSLNVGETVNFTARYEQAPEHSGREFGYQLEWGEDNNGHHIWHVVSSVTNASGSIWSVAVEQPSGRSEVTYRATVVLPDDSASMNPEPTYVNSETITVTWK